MLLRYELLLHEIVPTNQFTVCLCFLAPTIETREVTMIVG